jgi:hypothetical protein
MSNASKQDRPSLNVASAITADAHPGSHCILFMRSCLGSRIPLDRPDLVAGKANFAMCQEGILLSSRAYILKLLLAKWDCEKAGMSKCSAHVLQRVGRNHAMMVHTTIISDAGSSCLRQCARKVIWSVNS